MISRRALRIRCFQLLFAHFKQQSQASVEIIKRQCFQSLDKSYYFYLTMLSLLDEFRILELNDIEKQKKKFLKNHQQEFTPVFSNHPFLLTLENHKEFYQKLNEYKVNFGSDKDWVISIYRNFQKDELYLDYVQKKDFSLEATHQFIDNLIVEYLYHNDLLEHYFEEESQFANDDMYLSLHLVQKTIDDYYKTNEFKILSQYKDPINDKKFIEDLIQFTYENYFVFDKYIAKYSKNWDLERINFSDLLLIKMCMTELLYMPDIPLKTSVDEYIEISKEYSTPQSYVFINGIMVGVINDLKENGMLKKSIE